MEENHGKWFSSQTLSGNRRGQARTRGSNGLQVFAPAIVDCHAYN
jgi:hypothetical protein